MSQTHSQTRSNPEPNEAAAAAEWEQAVEAANREVAALEAAERAAAAGGFLAAEVTAVPRIGKGKTILQAGVVLTCAIAGLAASIALSGDRSSRQPEASSSQHTPSDGHSDSQSDGHSQAESHSASHAENSHGRGEPVGEPDAEMDGHRIDLYLRSGKFEAALRLCREVSPAVYGSDERVLVYREALCLEALGRYAEALQAYKKTVQPNPDLPPALWARGMLGQARCTLAARDIAATRELLDRVLLRSGDPACRDKRIAAECLFLMGCTEAEALGPHPPVDPFEITAIAWPAFEGGLDQYLDWLPAESPVVPVRGNQHSADAHRDAKPSEHPASAHGEPGHREPAGAHPSAHPDAGHGDEKHPAQSNPEKHTADGHKGEHPAPMDPGHKESKLANPPIGGHKDEKHAAPPAGGDRKEEKHFAPPEDGVEEKESPIAVRADGVDEKPHAPPEADRHEPKQPQPKDVGPGEGQRSDAKNKSSWLTSLLRKSRVTLKSSERSIADQLRSIGAEAGLNVHLDAAAEEKLGSISSAIEVERVPLAPLLTSLLRGHAFGWKVKGGTISIEAAGQSDESLERENALRALRLGLAAAPEHPRSRIATITAANLELKSGRRQTAAVEYRRFLENEPHRAETVYATYNLGLLELANSNLAVAQSRFLDTVDRGPGTKWADLGWWWIGRVQLDVGDTASARKPLKMVRQGKTKMLTAAAELATAACALLEGGEEEVREILFSHRVYNRDSHAAMVDFFDAYLKYKSNPSEMRANRVAESLKSIGEGRLLGPSGYLMAGRVYREIGWYDRSAGVYDAASAIVRGPLAMRMTFEAAERYDHIDMRNEARKRYTVVAAVDREALGTKAELRLAELAARDRRGQECVERSRALIGREGVDVAEVMALMGRGYELLKQYRQAAECFAGRIPEE